MKKLAILLLIPTKIWALSYQCKGDGLDFSVRNLNPHLASQGFGSQIYQHQNNPEGFIEYKGKKIVNILMVKSNSSKDENNMQTFLGTSFESNDSKSGLKMKIRFYGDSQGNARPKIRSWAKIYDLTKKDQDPQYFVLNKCVEISDTSEHAQKLKTVASQNAENNKIRDLFAKVPDSKERQKNKEVCSDVRKGKLESAVRMTLGEPKEITKSAGDGRSEETIWAYQNGIRVHFSFMETVTEVIFPDSMSTDCLFYGFERDLGELADKCVASIKVADLSYSKVKDCYLNACKTNQSDWPVQRCEIALNVIRPNAKQINDGGK